MVTITEKEKALLIKFKANIKDLKLSEDQSDDRLLIRWIRAKDGDLVKAEESLRASMEWRKANDMDNIQNWIVPENVTTECPYVVSGLDKEGIPVWFVPLGSWDLKKVAAGGQKEDVLKLIRQFNDRWLGRVQPSGSTEIVYVGDMDNYSLRQFTSKEAVEVIIEMIKQYDSNYPETLKYGVFLNASKVFSMLFPLLKIALGKQAAKFQVFSKGSEKAKAYLQEKFPLETIPTKFGGTNFQAQRILYPNEK